MSGNVDVEDDARVNVGRGEWGMNPVAVGAQMTSINILSRISFSFG